MRRIKWSDLNTRDITRLGTYRAWIESLESPQNYCIFHLSILISSSSEGRTSNPSNKTKGVSNESFPSNQIVSRVSQGQFEKKIRWKIISFFSPASQTNLVIETWNPSPRMRFCPFLLDSPREPNKPPKETAIPVSKPFSITSATPSILRSKTHVTRLFWGKYLEPAVLSNGKS